MINELADGIWSCEQDDGPRIVRQVVVAGDEAVLVVDTGLPGAPSADLLPLLARLGRRDVCVLISHPDSDHLGGTAELLAAQPAARVLAGALDLPLVGDPERMIRERYARFAVHDDVPFGTAASERAHSRAGPPFAGARAADPEVRLDLGGRTAELVPTPGHSPGHVAAWIPDAGLLAAGDAVMGNGIPTRDGGLLIPPMYAPPAAYRATIEGVRSLSPRVLASGHEPVLRDDDVGAFLDASRAACERLAALVAAALDDAPRTLLELCGRVHGEYGGLPDERVADLALTVDGHLADLIAAELVVVTSDNPRRFRSRA
jgi:glyoxylase-like metal-dependent hydrolase (beta-lactamase superfamily II)